MNVRAMKLLKTTLFLHCRRRLINHANNLLEWDAPSPTAISFVGACFQQSHHENRSPFYPQTHEGAFPSSVSKQAEAETKREPPFLWTPQKKTHPYGRGSKSWVVHPPQHGTILVLTHTHMTGISLAPFIQDPLWTAVRSTSPISFQGKVNSTASFSGNPGKCFQNLLLPVKHCNHRHPFAKIDGFP